RRRERVEGRRQRRQGLSQRGRRGRRHGHHDERGDLRADRKRRAESDERLHDRQAESQGGHGGRDEAPETLLTRMTWYTFFKSVHVIAAVIWVGGAAVTQLYALRALATNDGTRQAEFAKDAEVIGMRTFTPASFALFLAAI